MQNEILVIIPTYNEIENVEKMINTVLNLDNKIDILIVDDNSPDKTGEFVKAEYSKEKRVNLIERAGKLGLGTAYIEGFKFALEQNYEFINDLVIGSRYIQGVNVVNWPLRRLILSMGASLYTRIITGMPIKDATSGFKCFKRKVIEAIKLDEIHSNGYSFQIEMHYRSWEKGFKIKEIPIVFTDRIDGISKMGKHIVKEAIFMVWKLRFPKLFGKSKK
jgi:dolichol-phosphate mannosyltransferase